MRAILRVTTTITFASLLVAGCSEEADAPEGPLGWTTSVGTPAVRLAENAARDVDLNGDGHADLVTVDTARMSRHAVFYPGGPNGIRWDAVRAMEAPSTATAIWVEHAGDLDGDGYSDLVVGSHVATERAEVLYYRGSPSGPAEVPDLRLGRTEDPGPGTERSSTGALPAGDVNGDGFADLFVERPGESVALHLGGATGPRARPDRQFSSHPEHGGFHGLLPVGDLQGDGYDDVLFAWRDDDDVTTTLHRGSASGLDETGSLMPHEAPFARPLSGRSITSLDFDGDGVGDVFSQHGVGYTGPPHGIWHFWLKGDVAGYFGTARVLDGPAEATERRQSNMVQTAGADVNGDGHTDLLASWAHRIEHNPTPDRRGLGGYAGGPGRGEGERDLLSWFHEVDPELSKVVTSAQFAGHVACPGDIDKDGFQDCLLLGEGHVFLYRGSPDGPRFAEHREQFFVSRSVATRATLAAERYR